MLRLTQLLGFLARPLVALAIVEARVSTGSEANNGVFPLSWTFSGGTSAPHIFDGNTGGTSSAFSDKVVAIKLSKSAYVASITPSGSWSNLSYGYSADGANWTRLTTDGAQVSHTPGTPIAINATCTYIGIATGNGGATCTEIAYA